MEVKFLKPRFPKFQFVKKHLERVYANGIFSNYGPKNVELEMKLKEFFQFDGEVITCANGFLALMVALRAMGKKKALVPSFTFPATLQALKWAMVDYDFLEVDKHTWNVDLNDLEEKLLTREYDLIYPVHSFGSPCDVQSIARLSAINDVPVLYDAAAAIASLVNINGQHTHVSSFGDVSCFSLHATKVLPAGEGAVLFVKEKSLADRIRSLCNFGYDRTDANRVPKEEFGLNAKMSEITASFALASLMHISMNQQKRLELYGVYKKNLPGVEWQKLDEGCISSLQTIQFLIPEEIKDKRDEIIIKLLDRGIECKKYYNPPLHKLDIFKKSKDELPVTEDICSRIISPPFHLFLNEKEIEVVCSEIKQIINSMEHG